MGEVTPCWGRSLRIGGRSLQIGGGHSVLGGGHSVLGGGHFRLSEVTPYWGEVTPYWVRSLRIGATSGEVTSDWTDVRIRIVTSCSEEMMYHKMIV